ncbi:hypothetical protein [Bradyrhizobium retamae]|uniref:Uncharacterized protein n=1 Tax=Bradyrhizobium retamae TaxID=1300035 RepID=A0A0R3MNY3_9BRAD|nr:hypothetical protein [Bradyrhizobium retamae]KRR21723.1 hypothetical protein CQ13_06640 [Bradyrhizobium retamae]
MIETVRGFFTGLVKGTFISDFLWDIAISDVVLTSIGMFALCAAVVGYIPFGSLIPVVGGYVRAARALFILSLTILVFLLGFRTADRRAEAAELRAKMEIKDNVIATQKIDLAFSAQAAEEAADERKAAAERAKADQDRIANYAKQLEARGGNAACLLTDDDFPRRLRDDRK